MKSGITKYTLFGIILLVSMVVGHAQTQSSSAGVKVNPAQVQKKATMPPPSGAATASSAGQKVKVTTPSDSPSWVEQLDVDGDGNAEQTNLVWDNQHKVLLSDTSGTFTCKNGARASGELLIAINGTGNKWGRPVGSGFWLASMDKGQCGVQTDALWGCRFDASGNETACGIATLDQENNTLLIATAQQ